MFRLVCVYGSLMAGFYNHFYIKNSRSAFITHVKLTGRMYSVDDKFPAFVPTNNKKQYLAQLYAVDNICWRNMLRLEGSLYTVDQMELSDIERSFIPEYLPLVDPNPFYFKAEEFLIKDRSMIYSSSWYAHKDFKNPYSDNIPLSEIRKLYTLDRPEINFEKLNKPIHDHIRFKIKT